MSNEVRLTAIRPKQKLQVDNRSRGGPPLATDLRLALDAWGRLRGLLGRPPPREEQGLLLRPCRSVHTFFMSYPIDVAFLDEQGVVVALCSALGPWRVTRYHGQACATLELASGRLERTGTSLGDRLAFVALGIEGDSSAS